MSVEVRARGRRASGVRHRHELMQELLRRRAAQDSLIDRVEDGRPEVAFVGPCEHTRHELDRFDTELHLGEGLLARFAGRQEAPEHDLGAVVLDDRGEEVAVKEVSTSVDAACETARTLASDICAASSTNRTSTV